MAIDIRQIRLNKTMFSDALDASGSTVSDTSEAVEIGERVGAITLFFDPTLNSGTAQDVTVTADVKGINGDWIVDQAVGTITAAQITAGTNVFFSLSGLSWWAWFNDIRIKVAGASGTYNVTLNGSLEGH